MRVTFKKNPKETGLAGVADPYQGADIKVDGKICGYISPISWQKDSFRIYLAVKSDKEHCGWRNVKLKSEFQTYDECKAFVKENLERIVEQNKLELHFYDG